MKFKLLPLNGKAVWQNNKAFIWFLLVLLLTYSILKIIFYQYNHQLLFAGAENAVAISEKLRLVKWSITQDILTVLGINSILLFCLWAGRLVNPKISTWFTVPLFVLINSIAVILNLIDIFYFRFHFQRTNADLLYVLDHPMNRLMQQSLFLILIFVIAFAAIIYLMWRLHKKLMVPFANGHNAGLITAILGIIFLVSLLMKAETGKYLVPTYPMVQLKSNELPVVQNSFHTFLFSVFRNGESTPFKSYMTNAACDSIMPIRKKLDINMGDNNKQNIVLFIMESVPYDFFDSTSAYKVTMPFFDSLLNKSSFYNNAFCYAHESNKGITAILAGIPTVTDIPVYHSANINMPFTAIGKSLSKLNYHSFFCIGDEYDNFGFAKCMNWVGVDKYYSKEDIPGYKNLPKHSMGIQDEYVLDFFFQKVKIQQAPFLGVHYNISTHYPYDIPVEFARKLPANYSAPMKAMRYYDYCIQKFFDAAQKEPWFANTKFIFCSDHWLFPEGKKGVYNALSGYRIPVIIYDPLINKRQIINYPVSQFDILETILATAGYRDSLISYGENLLDSLHTDKVVFTKANANLYQVIDSSYILGFNSSNGKVEFLYNYKTDKLLKKNLVTDPAASLKFKPLSIKIKAFLQKANMQRNALPFK